MAPGLRALPRPHLFVGDGCLAAAAAVGHVVLLAVAERVARFERVCAVLQQLLLGYHRLLAVLRPRIVVLVKPRLFFLFQGACVPPEAAAGVDDALGQRSGCDNRKLRAKSAHPATAGDFS